METFLNLAKFFGIARQMLLNDDFIKQFGRPERAFYTHSGKILEFDM
jgi:hypothetical protein